jgi:hypothetical protein
MTMRIVKVIIGTTAFIAHFDDGSTSSVPYHLYPRLHYGSPEERNNFEIICRGEGIHWFDLDADISVEDILEGGPSHESRKSLFKWLAGRNQLTAEA